MNPGIKLTLYFICFITLLSLSSFSCHTANSVENIKKSSSLVHWKASDKLSSIVDLAVEEDKVIFLNMVTDWCLPCKMMDEDVFSHKATADYLNNHFVNYKVDAEKLNGPNLKYLYEVKTIPTLIFLDQRGRIILRHEGAAYHTKLIELAETALSNS